jgi:hypothetical protein
MNRQEIQTLGNFLRQLVQARAVAKDLQADSMIAGAVAQQPDATYLLVQRALLMEHALHNAKARIASLQSQLEAAKSPPARGFLDAETWGNIPAAAARPPVSMSTAPTYVQQPAPVQSQPPAASRGMFGGALRGRLGTVAATAAGVAGSAFLFQGIEHLMHPGGTTGLMNPAGMASLSSPMGGSTVNHFYETSERMTSGSALDFLATDGPGLDDDSMPG